MRSLIRFSAGIFVLTGLLILVMSATATYGIVSQKGIPSGAEIIILLIPLVGVIWAASIVLIGGATYVLTSIDARLEYALKREFFTTPAA